MWSLGCILYEMCALRPPFMANNMSELANKVMKGKFEQLPKKYSRELNRFIAAMIRVTPHNRPSIMALLENENIPQECTSDRRESIMLRTIKVPKNLRKLTLSLPLSKYDEDLQSVSTLPSLSHKKKKKYTESVSMHRLPALPLEEKSYRLEPRSYKDLIS